MIVCPCSAFGISFTEELVLVNNEVVPVVILSVMLLLILARLVNV